MFGDLKRRRLVDEDAAIPPTKAGRPVSPLRITGESWAVIGLHIDIDGVAARLCTVGGELIAEFSFSADLFCKGPAVGVRLLRRALTQAVSRLGDARRVVAVEIALPGLVARDTGVVGQSTALDWHNVPLADVMRAHAESLGIGHAFLGIDNDINHAALAAVRSELPRPSPQTIAYIGGKRGIGGGIVIDGNLFGGAHGGAGEFGHLPVERVGRACPCGRRGCLETRVGLLNLVVDSGLMGQSEAEKAVKLDPVAACLRLATAAESNDRAVLATLRRAGTYLGTAVEIMLNTLNPDMVLIGGNMARLGHYMIDGVMERTEATRGFAAYRQTQFVVLPSLSGRTVRGAAIAAIDACLTHPLGLTEAIG